MLSGCEDAQTSADARGAHGLWGGAMTTALAEVLRDQSSMAATQRKAKNYSHAVAPPKGLLYPILLQRIHKKMKEGGFSQRPCLSSSQAFDPSARFFGIEMDPLPNTNPQNGRLVRQKFAGSAKPRRLESRGLFDLLMGAAVLTDVVRIASNTGWVDVGGAVSSLAYFGLGAVDVVGGVGADGLQAVGQMDMAGGVSGGVSGIAKDAADGGLECCGEVGECLGGCTEHLGGMVGDLFHMVADLFGRDDD